MKKLFLVLALLNVGAYAEVTKKSPNAPVSGHISLNKPFSMNDFKPLDKIVIDEIVKKEAIIGKKFINNCDNLGEGETCELFLYKIFEMQGGSKIRVIKYGSMVTMDYSPNRLNVELDKENKIIKLTIG